jgi:hypothetical protein
MDRSSDTGARKFSIKVEAKELDRIIQARKNLDDVKALAIYAVRYRNLKWSPVALDVPQGADLKVDFQQPEAKCLWSLMDLALQEVRVGLAVRLEKDSPLFVLRVRPALGRTLDRLGNWRSPCMARLGDLWEHHFLLLPEGCRLPPETVIADKEAPLSVIGPGQLVTAPPSVEPLSGETWHWSAPPWEEPPPEPTPELLILLEDCGFISRKRGQWSAADLPSWKEIYPRVSHSDKLLQALLAPEESSDLYYRKILLEALQAGVQDLSLLLGLLWYAPHSELRLDPDGQEQLSLWAEKLEGLVSVEAQGADRAAPAEPEGEAAPGSQEGSMTELHILAAQTLQLERQLEELEDLAAAGETAEANETGLSQEDPIEELAELRQAVEDFLAGIKKMSEPG